MKKELKTASNIKDRRNRHGVQSALKKMIYQLQDLKVTGDTGVALFAGKWWWV